MGDEEIEQPSLIDTIQKNMAKRASQAMEAGEDGDMELGVASSLQSNWRRDVLDKYREGDVRGMIEKAAPVAQMSVIEMATEADDEKVRLAASQQILAQAGHGPISKLETKVVYDNLPEDQLAAMVMSKIRKIGAARPQLLDKLKALLPEGMAQTLSSKEGHEVVTVESEEIHE